MDEKLKNIDPEVLKLLQENPELLIQIGGDKFKISVEKIDQNEKENSEPLNNDNEEQKSNVNTCQSNAKTPPKEQNPNMNINMRRSRAKSPNLKSTHSIDSLSMQDSFSQNFQNTSIKEVKDQKSNRVSNRYFTSSRTPSLSEIEKELEGMSGKEGEQLKKIAKALKRQRKNLDKSSSHTSVFGMKDDPLKALITELRVKKMKEMQTPTINETSLHLAFIFSSPLVMAVTDNRGFLQKRPMKSPIQYRKELKLIEESFRETGTSLRYQASHASLNSFQTTLDKKPFCLHFCGHGIRNSSDILGTYIDRKQGDFLVFEDENLSADFVSCKAISRMLEKSKCNTKLVFVASCHSELVGNVFLEAGASHVICVRREEKIMDLACQSFSKAFYNALIPGQLTICESFDAALTRVFADFKIPPGEENKFKLLVDTEEQNHNCSYFPMLFPGEPANLSPVPQYLHIPSSIDNFVGRDREMNEIISNFNAFRLVSVIGIPGIGKSAIAKEVSMLLKERNFFKDGISFFQLRNIESAESLQSAIDGMIHEVSDAKSKSDDRSKLLLKIVTSLKSKEILFIFDNCDLILIGPEKMRFRMILECLLTSCPKLKILCTNRSPIGGPLGDTPEKLMKIQSLNPLESKILFNYHVPKRISQDPSPLLDLLRGHPYAITLAAGLLSDNSIDEVVSKLNYPRPSFTFPSLEDSGPLKLSMDLSLEWVSNKFNESAGRLFGVFGLLPGGITENDLDFVMGEPCEENLKVLTNSSLVIKSGKNYLVYPFMLKYAENRISVTEKRILHKRIISLYAKKTEEVFYIVGSVTGTEYEIYDNFREYEVNIKASVYREKGSEESLLNRLSFFPLDESELEEQDSVSMPLTKESLKLLQLSSKPNNQMQEMEKPNSKPITDYRQKGLGQIEMPIAGRMSHKLDTEKSSSNNSSRDDISGDKIEAVNYDAAVSYLKSPMNHLKEEEEVKIDSINKELEEKPQQSANSSFSFKIGFGNSSSNSREMSRDFGLRRKGLGSKKGEKGKQNHQIKKKISNLNKLIIQYTAILLMMRRYKECLSMIELALALQNNDNLFYANILKIKASLSFISKDMISSFNEFSEAEELFREVGCLLGIAICTGAKGYIKFIIGEHGKSKLYLESSLKTYKSLLHSYGEHYIHRWLAAVKRKIGSQANQSQGHVDAARKALKGNKALKEERFKHSGGYFVLRWMGDNISLFLENAFELDTKPVKGGKMEKMERISMLQKEDVKNVSDGFKIIEF